MHPIDSGGAHPGLSHVRRLAGTFSIVARDPASGELGVGVQSHYFACGSLVPWAEPGVGAVATQAFVEICHGPGGLEQLARGASSSEALGALLAADPGPELRQVALVDAGGGIAVHTGGRCVAAAGDRAGEGFCVQGNMLRSGNVWDAMASAYGGAEGDLAARILAALGAGERAGGDLRGRRSAALLVVSGERAPRAGEGRLFDLRVDDALQPVAELERLVEIRRAGRCLEGAIAAAVAGRIDEARELFAEAQKRHPENPEYGFWAGISLAGAGRTEEARAWLREAFAADPAWLELARRLTETDLLRNDPQLLAELEIE